GGLLTSIMNPYNGTTGVGPAMTTSGTGRGAHVIPRADGTFLIVLGNAVPNSNVVETQIYYPTGGAIVTALTVPMGTFSASTFGPDLTVGGGTTAAALTPTLAAGTGCDAGTHSYRYTNVTNGIESLEGAISASVTCVAVSAGQVNLTVIAAGPTGTTARKVYRTTAGNALLGPWKLLTTISDNTTTTFTDTTTDASLGANAPAGPGDGSLSFQRPDGKFVTLFGGAATSNRVNLYDAGWYSDGQYLSEMMQVPALSANATMEWQKTADSYVRFEARAASSAAALDVTPFKGVDSPGNSINNSGGETWVQVEINFRRDFPTFCSNLNDVYVSGGAGGGAYCYRNISLPTVLQYQISNGQDLLSLQTNSYNVLRVTSSGGIYSSQQGGFFAGGADLAENYSSNQTLEAGEVVAIDPSRSEAVMRTNLTYQDDLVGVVSTTPGLVTGAYTKDGYPIALIGRVPVKVSTEGGSIQAGDYLTSASIAGYAMKATVAGRVIGKALEAIDPAKLTDCPKAEYTVYVPGRKCSTILMFVNLTNYYGSPLDVVMAEKKAAQAASDNGLDTTVTSENNSDGLQTPSNVRLAISAPTKEEEMLGFLKTLRDERRANSAPTSEILADRISATGEIISPTIIADTIFAKHIKADSIEGLQIFTDQISSLSEKYAGLQAGIADAAQNGATPQTDAAMKAMTIESAKVTLALQVLGKLSADGGIVVGGDAEFNGDTLFNRFVTFVSDTIFKGKVSFEKAPTFGADTAGFAVIEKGARKVRITFDEAYARQPIVTASLTNDQSPLLDGKEDASLKADVALVENDFLNNIFDGDIRFLITEKGIDGFTVVLNKAAPYDLQFSWVAIAVTHSKTFTSERVDESEATLPPVTLPPVETPPFVTETPPVTLPSTEPETVSTAEPPVPSTAVLGETTAP
ncbi:MAG: hypothetical protein ABI747_01175, partial [Candidatus Moraniibacteriota bacterium]